MTNQSKLIVVIIPVFAETLLQPLFQFRESITISEALLVIQHSHFPITEVLPPQRSSTISEELFWMKYNIVILEWITDKTRSWWNIIHNTKKVEQKVASSQYSRRGWHSERILQIYHITNQILMRVHTIMSVTSMTPIIPRPMSALCTIAPTLLYACTHSTQQDQPFQFFNKDSLKHKFK